MPQYCLSLQPSSHLNVLTFFSRDWVDAQKVMERCVFIFFFEGRGLRGGGLIGVGAFGIGSERADKVALSTFQAALVGSRHFQSGAELLYRQHVERGIENLSVFVCCVCVCSLLKNVVD